MRPRAWSKPHPHSLFAAEAFLGRKGREEALCGTQPVPPSGGWDGQNEHFLLSFTFRKKLLILCILKFIHYFYKIMQVAVLFLD